MIFFVLNWFPEFWIYKILNSKAETALSLFKECDGYLDRIDELSFCISNQYIFERRLSENLKIKLSIKLHRICFYSGQHSFSLWGFIVCKMIYVNKLILLLQWWISKQFFAKLLQIHLLWAFLPKWVYSKTS